MCHEGIFGGAAPDSVIAVLRLLIWCGGADELGRKRRDNRIAVGAQSSHAAGYPMSQRECAGFNWPRFSVCAGEPIKVGPSANVASADNGFPLE